MRTVRTKLYRFTELSAEIQSKVLDRRINEMLEYESEEHYENWPEFKKAVDRANSLQTPWFTLGYVMDYCGKAIKEALMSEDDETEYYNDGRIYIG
jgi:hypothetical protein